jgi:hypothetical protein
MLKMSSIFSKTSIHVFSVFLVTLWSVFWVHVGNSLFSIVSFPPSFVGCSNILFLWEIPPKSGGVKSGDSCDQRPQPTMHLPKNSCSKAVVGFTVWAVAPSCWNQQSLSPGNTVRRRTYFLLQTLRVSRNCVTSRWFGTSLSVYALLNASANYFDAK